MERKGKANPVKLSGVKHKRKPTRTIRSYLTSEPILRLPGPGKIYFLRADASNSGIGAVLMQKHDEKLFPVCYASKKLTGAERNYSKIEKMPSDGMEYQEVSSLFVRSFFCSSDGP